MMSYFRLFLVCVVCYGVSGFPEDFIDDDKLVIPLKASTKTKSIETPRHKMNMKFHQFRQIKPESEESANHNSDQSKFSKVQFSSSSFSSRFVSSNNNTQETEASSKFHATSVSDGTTQLNQTESIAKAKENKTINGCTDNRESVAAVKAVEIAKKNPDGGIQTIGKAVAESAISQTAGGETKSQELKAATIAKIVKDAAGEEYSKVKGFAQAKETKTTNGHIETTKTLAAGESEQVTHDDGKSEQTDKFVVLLPDRKKVKSNNNYATNTGKEKKRRENDNQGSTNKKINHTDLNTDKKPECSRSSSTNDKIIKASENLNKPYSKENSDVKDIKSKFNKTEKATNNSNIDKITKQKEKNKIENKGKENDAFIQTEDKDSDIITEEKRSVDEYNEENSPNDDEDETDDTDSESDTDNDNTDSEKDTDNDEKYSVITHHTDYTSTDNRNDKDDDSGVRDS